MPFRPYTRRLHARRPRPWRRRLLVLVLGGLFLVTFDCGSLLHGPEHTHDTSSAYTGVAAAQPVEEAAEEDAPLAEPCSLLGHDAEGDGRNQSQPLPPNAGVALVAPLPGGAVLATSKVPRSHGMHRARSVRSRLTLACMWRI